MSKGLFFFTFLLSCVSLNAQHQTAKRADNGMGYLEYLPPNYIDDGEKYPLLIFLHGSGERGSGTPADLESVKRQGVPKQIENGETMCFEVNGEEECFIVLSPQTNGWGWLNTVVDFTTFALDNYPIDQDRVYVTGLSMGGKGAWQAGYTSHNQPNYFAALAPLSADGSTSSLQQIADYHIPVWAFHGDNDTAIPIGKGQAMINNLINAGADPLPIFTVYEGYGHSSSLWDKVYSVTNEYHSPNIYQWLLQQKRSGSDNGLSAPQEIILTLDTVQKAVSVSWQGEEPQAMELVIQKKSTNTDFVNLATISLMEQEYSDSDISNSETYAYRARYISENDSSDYSPEREIQIVLNDNPSLNEVIIDNSNSGVTKEGNWSVSTFGGSKKYGNNYFHDDNSDKGNKSINYSTNLIAGQYDVYGWWVAYENRASNTIYEVQHALGTSNIIVDQRTEGNNWVFLGNFTFESDANVIIKNGGTDGYVIADAIRFNPTVIIEESPEQPNELIIDNVSSEFTLSGDWQKSSAGGNSKYGTDYYHDGNFAKGSSIATFQTEVTGTYQIFGYWFAYENRSTNTPFIIYHNNGPDTIRVNQQTNNAQWVSLGTFEFESTALVTVSNAGTDGYVVADAIKLVNMASNGSANGRTATNLQLDAKDDKNNYSASKNRSTIFPNPVLDHVHLSIAKSHDTTGIIQIIDGLGKIIFEKTYDKKEVDFMNVNGILSSFNGAVGIIRILSSSADETIRFFKR